MPKAKDIKLNAFKLTISTKYDISQTTVDLFAKWAQKRATMHHVVLETGSSGVKHLHALLCFQDGYIKRNLEDYVWRQFVQNHNEESTKIVSTRADVLYDDRWIMEYLSKEEDAVVVSSDYDAAREGEFYPDQATQEHLQTVALVNSSCDTVFADHEQRYWIFHRSVLHPGPGTGGLCTPTTCFQYYLWRMNCERTMRVCTDERRNRQNGLGLYRYITKDYNPGFEDRKYYASYEGPVMDFRG